jgi:DNA-binding transcriptional MerR regulator
MQADYSIGQLAVLSGLPVKTVRFYSDAGLLVADRAPSRHRRFSDEAVARLQLVRSLRELDVDLPTIRRVLEGQHALGDVLKAHVNTLETRIRGLQRQLAVLKAAATSPTKDTVRRVQTHVKLEAEERKRLLDTFWDRVFEDSGADPSLEAHFRQMGNAELPENPTPEQLDAWLELAELSSNEDFIRTTRANNAWGKQLTGKMDARAWAEAMRHGSDQAADLMDQGVAVSDPRAQEVAGVFVSRCAAASGSANTPAYRRELVTQIQAHTDPRAARYWALVAIVRGMPPMPGQERAAKAFVWLLEAVKAG